LLQFEIYENITITASIPIAVLIFQSVEFEVDKIIIEYKGKDGSA
jgi:hypothetical protein